MTLSIPPLRRVGRLAAVMAVALAAGHVVQTMAARKAQSQVAAAVLPTKIVELSAAPDEAGLTAPLLAPKAETRLNPLPEQHLSAPTQPEPKPQVAHVIDCAPKMGLTLADGAMVNLSLSAPCDGNARVVVDHAGLTVTERLSPEGRLMVQLPAMEAEGRFKVRFADGRSADLALPVPEMKDVQRFAVQWLGGDGFILHGFEGGADFGERGDISPEQPGIVGVGGWMTLLGAPDVDNALLAQVYTFPADGSADVVIEAPVTATSCGQDKLGQTIRSADGAAVVTDLTLAMPDCSAVGDFLVLKNLVQDTKLAAK